MVSTVRVCQNRFNVVVRGWVPVVLVRETPVPLFPQAKVPQDTFDHSPIIDEGHDAHFPGAIGAEQRIGFPHPFDQLAAFFWRGRNPVML